jgi:GH15 family glucan-1,4-alpha-glucosidase
MHPEHEHMTIGDYAVIGDCRSAALVSRSGSIDWLAWPRFDSESIFAALLDDQRGGTFSVRPVGAFEATRAYVDGTNVLRTRFVADQGTLIVTDLMTIADDGEHRRALVPEHELLRIVECAEGQVEVEIVFDPRPGFRPARISMGRDGVRVIDGARLTLLRGVDGMTATPEGGVRKTLHLAKGERVALSLVHAAHDPAVIMPLGDAAMARAETAIAWWRRWSSRARYDGPYREQVVRSALALKLLCYGPSGAVIAAPTTSLPEQPGGTLNWDYRYCWLRDASLTANVLYGLGYDGEGDAFVDWLIHATRLTRPQLRVLYDVFGRNPSKEVERWSLAGYADSRPVRIGNAAADQFQLDVYGEVIDAVAQRCRRGHTPDPETTKMLRQFAEFVCHHWQRPDDGVWESRRGAQHYVYSRVMSWVALDRVLELAARGYLALGAALRDRIEKNRDMIADEVRSRGWSEQQGSYVEVLDGDTQDASLLLLSWYGFEPADSARMCSTFERIDRVLGAGNGLLRRNLSIDEGAFGICSFWGVEQLARGGGTLAAAEERFSSLLHYANDVGLFAEETDPSTGAAIGNFPQGFTHVGLVNAAMAIERRRRDEKDAAR